MDAIATAQDTGATKDAIATNLGITRPTLDEWIRNSEDRILFNDALATITKPGLGNLDSALINRLYSALGIRSIPTQAAAVLEGIRHIDTAALSAEQSDLIQQATARARQLT
jgi:transposase-like protein